MPLQQPTPVKKNLPHPSQPISELDRQRKELERKILSRLDVLERKLVVLDQLNKDVDAIKHFCNKMHRTMSTLRRATMNEPMFPTAKKPQNGPTTTQK